MRALLEGQGTLTFIDAAQVHLVNEKECLARPSPSPFLKKTTRIHPYIFFLGGLVCTAGEQMEKQKSYQTSYLDERRRVSHCLGSGKNASYLSVVDANFDEAGGV